MSPTRLLNSHKFNRVAIAVLVIWIASATVGIYLLTRFDALVHGQLYDFGLQFDQAWADAYYSYAQLMYIALAVPIALSLFSIMLGFKSITDKKPEPTPQVQPKPQQVICPKPQAVTQELKPKVKENNIATSISCPNCKKVFSRPLVMLNFESGKNKLVNVCPYCNQVLSDAEGEAWSEGDFRIRYEDKSLRH